MARQASTPAIRFLADAAVPFEVHAYDLAGDEADTYGEAVAVALGVEGERLFKTLIAEVDGEPVVGIVPVSERLWLKGLAAAAGGKKAEMADPAVAERLTGYVTGGISPFGQKRPLASYVDETIELFDTVFVSAGRRGLQVEVAPSDLIALLDAGVAEIAG